MQPGTQLGHYEVTDLLGKGGMGEVYRARDTKLGREVAIKVLPSEFSQDTERLARLEREARMLASLNHPNIAAIHGLEESDDTRFLVLELVEGDTLADRLRGGAIAVEEALKVALQISEALEAAHEKGVIHRDLKPANIKITPEGRVKVLDFGLAKAFVGDQADVNLSNSPTLSMQATQAGIILGTAAYMSPEQASGEVADHRADVWAFGVILYEMLTGRQLFTGKTASHVMGAVLNIEPDWDALPSNLHPRVRMLLERALEKEPRDRLSGISDARVEIHRVLAEPEGGVVEQLATAAEPGQRVSVFLAVAVGLAAIVAASALTWWLAPNVTPEVVRFDHELVDGVSLRNVYSPAIAMSPDGRRLAYNTSSGLWVLSLDEFEARLLPGTQGPLDSLMFSPDGESLAFGSPEGLMRLSIGGGSPVQIAATTRPIFGGGWIENGDIIFSAGGELMRVSSDGGVPQPLFEDSVRRANPQLLPNGQAVLFTLAGLGTIAVQPLDSPDYQELFPGVHARYVSTGHIVFGLGESLYAIGFDPNRYETLGGPVALIDGILGQGPARQYSVSASGELAYVPGRAGSVERELVWVDRSGTETPIAAAGRRTFTYPRISPDGQRVALDVRDQEMDIWIWDIERESLDRFTFDSAGDFYPVWTTEADQIAFESGRTGGATRLFRKASNNPTSEVEPLTENVNVTSGINGYFFTPDNAFLVFREQLSAESGDNIGMVSLDDDAEPVWLLDTEFNERNAELSPDGRWMAYQSNQSGNWEVYVRPFPNVDDDAFRISNAGGEYPLWSRSGEELFYIEPGEPAHIVSVAVALGEEFNWDVPEEVVEWRYFTQDLGRTYDVSSDGQRFLVIDPNPAGRTADSAPKVNVVLNWFQELRERVPVD